MARAQHAVSSLDVTSTPFQFPGQYRQCEPFELEVRHRIMGGCGVDLTGTRTSTQVIGLRIQHDWAPARELGSAVSAALWSFVTHS